MGDIPLQTRIYTSILVVITVMVLIIGAQRSVEEHGFELTLTAIILIAMIIVVEKWEIDFPHASFQFSISVGAILALAAGLTLGPLMGALVVIIAELVSDTWERLKPIQIVVNSSNLGLATFCGGYVYHAMNGGAATPITNAQSMIATVTAAFVYTTINSGVLAIIIAPVVGENPIRLWRNNSSVTYIVVILPTLASLVPVIANVNPLGILILLVPLIGSHLAQQTLKKVEYETQLTMEGLADALERRDPYTHRHSIRVTDYVKAILDELPHIPANTKQVIVDAARIHDLGKVGTQDMSLQKPGPLTEAERAEMQQHSAIGADIVGKLEIYRHSAIIVRHHHERWDGKGYPDGLKGEEIPLGSRIINVADSFDAMTSDRPYRRAMPVEAALAEIRRGKGTQFDPTIVEAFDRALTRPYGEPERSVVSQPAS